MTARAAMRSPRTVYSRHNSRAILNQADLFLVEATDALGQAQTTTYPANAPTASASFAWEPSRPRPTTLLFSPQPQQLNHLDP